MSVKLLIADDEDMIRNGIAKYIELHTDRFDKIYLAENGQTALDFILRYRPELLLLDIQMPLKNGLEVMKEAKEAGVNPVTVILSGHDDFKYAQQAVRYGVKDYLLKPCRSSDILSKLNELADELDSLPPGMPINKLTGKPEEKTAIRNPAVHKAVEYMREHYDENLTAQQVADSAGITAGYLSTLFTQHLGCGFVDCLNEIRIEYACTYLHQNFLKNYEIAYKVGFKDEKYFSRVFKKLKGVSPSEYRAAHIMS